MASTQILNHYRNQNPGSLKGNYFLMNKGFKHKDITDDALYLNLPQYAYDFDGMALDLESVSASQTKEAATFIYHVAASLTAQLGNGEGSSATGKQI